VALYFNAKKATAFSKSGGLINISELLLEK